MGSWLVFSPFMVSSWTMDSTRPDASWKDVGGGVVGCVAGLDQDLEFFPNGLLLLLPGRPFDFPLGFSPRRLLFGVFLACSQSTAIALHPGKGVV